MRVVHDMTWHAMRMIINPMMMMMMMIGKETRYPEDALCL